jgi:hypothetical protein
MREMEAKNPVTLVKAISEIAAGLPPLRVLQLYEFALFLQSHPLPAEETLARIVTDEALWDAQFAATRDEEWAALVASVEAEIREGNTLPMFDEHGEFIADSR